MLEACLTTGAMRNTRVPSLPKSPLSPDKRVARLQAEETGSATSKGSSHFGGDQFWGALRNAGLEKEVTSSPARLCMLTSKSPTLGTVRETEQTHASVSENVAHYGKQASTCYTFREAA